VAVSAAVVMHKGHISWFLYGGGFAGDHRLGRYLAAALEKFERLEAANCLETKVPAEAVDAAGPPRFGHPHRRAGGERQHRDDKEGLLGSSPGNHASLIVHC